jgi:hypothetical protein
MMRSTAPVFGSLVWEALHLQGGKKAALLMSEIVANDELLHLSLDQRFVTI